MTRNDCMWVAVRCTGLVLLILVIRALPDLPTAWKMHQYANAQLAAPGASGTGALTQSITTIPNEIGRSIYKQTLTKVVLWAVLAVYFLAGAPGLYRWLVRESLPPSPPHR